MKRGLTVVLTALVLLSGLFSSSSLQAKEAEKSLQVICTILPIYIFTLNVVERVPGIEVKLLLSPYQGCPHNYDLTPGDVLNLSRADIIIANGLGMESYLKPFIRTKKNKTTYIEASAKISPILDEPLPATSKVYTQKAKPDHSEELNGHSWVSPEAAAVMVETIAEGLAQRDKLQASNLLANGRRYAGKLRNLSREMKEIVSRSKNKTIVAFHDILSYLARDMGLKVAAVIEKQLGIEPSAKDMIRLIQIARNEKAAAIFSEPPHSDKVVRILSRESGVPWFPFDPVASGKPEAETYEKVMRQNIEILRRALR